MTITRKPPISLSMYNFDDGVGRALRQINSGADMPFKDKFTAIALVCGPPYEGFIWNKIKVADFTRLARELFNLTQPRDLRGLYELYEKWHAGEDLDRMLAERGA